MLTIHRETARINCAIQACPRKTKNVRRVWFKEDSSSTFERTPRIFVKLNFRELCGSKLSDLHPFDNMAIIRWIKNRLKTER